MSGFFIWTGFVELFRFVFPGLEILIVVRGGRERAPSTQGANNCSKGKKIIHYGQRVERARRRNYNESETSVYGS